MNNPFAPLPELLLPWYRESRRDLPWRSDPQPYHVWLSEIMLQQTRVEAVKGYYLRFLQALPTVKALAEAPEEQCRKLWEGLGYYTRVRNLQKAAREIVSRSGGEFPQTYEEIRRLPGVGDYTAGAVASICFGLPTPAVDGNVLRVTGRLLADPTPVTDGSLRRRRAEQLAEIYPRDHAGEFTQALMELGATVCLPNGAPRCEVCPLRQNCRGAALRRPEDFPGKPPKKPRRQEDLTVFLFRCGGRTAVRRRQESGLLAGLWEYPNVPGHLDLTEAIAQAEAWGVHPKAPRSVREKTHIFTHVQWNMRCFEMECSAMPEPFRWATDEERKRDLALPTAFRILTE